MCIFRHFFLLFIGAHQQNHTHVMHNKMARKLFFVFFFLIAQQRQCQSITQKFQLSFVYQTQTKISIKKKNCKLVSCCVSSSTSNKRLSTFFWKKEQKVKRTTTRHTRGRAHRFFFVFFSKPLGGVGRSPRHYSFFLKNLIKNSHFPFLKNDTTHTQTITWNMESFLFLTIKQNKKIEK